MVMIRLRLFSEADDRVSGPPWAKALMLAAVAVGCLAFAAFVVSLASGVVPLAAGALFVGAFAVSAGASWHLGLRGRAKNGLVLAVLGASAVVALSMIS